MDEESKKTESAQARIPAPPSAAKARASLRLAKSVNRKNPTARPAKANADQGNNGKNYGRCVVQSGGVAIGTITAATIPVNIVRILAAVTLPSPVAQHNTPISIMDSPRIFRTSTRSRSVHGDHG